MHAFLAYGYHLGLRVLLSPLWHPAASSFGVAAIGRLAGFRNAALIACAAVLAGWLMLDPHWTGWPPEPVARLPGLALILGIGFWLGSGSRPGWVTRLVTAALLAWWLRGAPVAGAGILGCVPVFLGLAAALPLSHRLVRADVGWGCIIAALCLALALPATGAAPHWRQVAIVPAVAALVLFGRGAGAAIAGTIVLGAAATIVASDQGRLAWVDAACLVPLLVWAGAWGWTAKSARRAPALQGTAPYGAKLDPARPSHHHLGMALVQTVRMVLAPPHRAGHPFIAGGLAVAVAGLFIGYGVFWIGLAFALFCFYFFRDPERTPPSRAAIISAADGRVVSVQLAAPPAELGLGAAPRWRVATFLSILNVHVNRVPADGIVTAIAYHAGTFLNASVDKASTENERNALAIRLPDGRDLAVVQIAGLVARRILCDVRQGDTLRAGSRFGIIRFGSRTDLYLPHGVLPLVAVGQTMIGGETVVANLTAS